MERRPAAGPFDAIERDHIGTGSVSGDQAS